MSQLNDLKNLAAREAGLNLDNKEKGLCVKCGQPALERCYSAAGRSEFRISGMCEICFDEMFRETHEPG